MKLKASYVNESDLKKLLQDLGSAVTKQKISKNDKGSYKKAYIEVNYNTDSSNENAV